MEFISKDLKESNELLNSVLDSTSSAILIVNKELKVVNFNNSFKNLFYKEDFWILGRYYGNALGCSFVVNENTNCGRTTNCKKCKIRDSILNTFTEKVPAYKQKVIHKFFINETEVSKYLEFTTKLISLNGEDFTIVIIDDITENELQKIAIYSQNEKLTAAKAELEQAYEKLQQEEARMLKLEQHNSVMAMIVTANHEINQPLAVLKGNLGLLKAHSDKNNCHGVLLKYIEKIENAVNDIATILKKYRESETDFDFGNYTKEIKMVNFKSEKKK